jgi:hypothetical protein
MCRREVERTLPQPASQPQERVPLFHFDFFFFPTVILPGLGLCARPMGSLAISEIRNGRVREVHSKLPTTVFTFRNTHA